MILHGGDGGFYLHENDSFVHIAADGSSKAVLFSDAASFGLNTCPDGKTILLSWVGRGALDVNVWRMDANGANLKKLTYGKLDFNPVCSADSKQVYYPELNADIMRVPADGSSKPEAVPGTAIPNSIVGRWWGCRRTESCWRL